VADRSVDVLLIGGGTASAACAQELRAAGFDGTITLAGRELDPPYERPPITKDYLRETCTKESAFCAVPDDVEVLTRTPVMKLDPAAREAKLATKETLGFGQALIATGANVRRLPLDGDDLEGIHYLRALRNADALRRDATRASRVALIGGSFIACEVAASLSEMGKETTLVFPEAEPLSLQFGMQVGRWVRGLLESHGIEIRSGEQVRRLEGDSGGVRFVVCSEGPAVECQAVVVGTGSVPDVMLARSSGLELGDRGGVKCSSRLETSVPGVYAAGDMCEYDSVVHGHTVRIEHHEVAAGQGRCAARNMAGQPTDYDEVPYFWSDLASWAKLESVGPAVDGWDQEVVRGSFDDGAWTVFYLLEGRVVAAATSGRTDDLDEARELISGRAAADPAALAAAP
jgi:3-phenylpropionate/trans-cinnamate dioxygenase ferredoxin reductase subunit